MKFLPLAFLTVALCLTSGCGILLPKQVELFQKKVKPVPELSESARERQREAADLLARQHPTNNVAGALSDSLGPPYSHYTGDPDRLANRIWHDQAELNEDLRDYAANVEPLVGKKIEGTGLIQVGYFKFIGLIIGFFALIWFGLRVYGIMNPVVGTATGVIGRVSSAVLHKGFTELTTGGQQFLQWIKPEVSGLDQKTADWVTNTFKLAHQTQQSPETQAVVDKLVASNVTPSAPLTQAPK